MTFPHDTTFSAFTMSAIKIYFTHNYPFTVIYLFKVDALAFECY